MTYSGQQDQSTISLH